MQPYDDLPKCKLFCGLGGKYGVPRIPPRSRGRQHKCDANKGLASPGFFHRRTLKSGTHSGRFLKEHVANIQTGDDNSFANNML